LGWSLLAMRSGGCAGIAFRDLLENLPQVSKECNEQLGS
jgi:hypothetical protein